eukprot:scaffold1809_cov386-Prasinococcus_capsulatus_cf.AAC.7
MQAMRGANRKQEQLRPGADAEILNCPTCNTQVYVQMRRLNPIQRLCPAAAALGLHIGLCHFMVLIHDTEDGSVHQFDFGPRGGELISGDLRTARFTSSSLGKPAVATAALGTAPTGYDNLPIEQFQHILSFPNSDISQAENVGAAHSKSQESKQSEMVPCTSSRQVSTPAQLSPVNYISLSADGEIRHQEVFVHKSRSQDFNCLQSNREAIHYSPPDAALSYHQQNMDDNEASHIPPAWQGVHEHAYSIGCSRLSVDEVRRYVEEHCDSAYQVYKNDCRHFVNQLVEQCTGVRYATKRAIQSYVGSDSDRASFGDFARQKLVDFFDVEHGPAFRFAASAAHTACFSAVFGFPAAYLLRLASATTMSAAPRVRLISAGIAALHTTVQHVIAPHASTSEWKRLSSSKSALGPATVIPRTRANRPTIANFPRSFHAASRMLLALPRRVHSSAYSGAGAHRSMAWPGVP